MKTLVISSSEFSSGSNPELPYEVQGMLDAAAMYYPQVLLINPNDLQFLFDASNGSASVFHKDTSYASASSLIVRSTFGCEESTRLLALSLYSSGCELLDPIERFNGSLAGKSTMSLKGMRDKSLPETFIAFSEEQAVHMADKHIPDRAFPLVGKPTVGSRGENVELLRTRKETREYAQSFFRRFPGLVSGIIFQRYIDIAREFRVIMLDGRVVGMVEKSEIPDTFGRNAAKGSKFLDTYDDDVAEYTRTRVSNKGLLGVDTAIDREGKLYIIESNRSPQWKAFEQATGLNVAAEIMNVLEKRHAVTSELF